MPAPVREACLPRYIDSTMLATLKSCQLKFFHEYCLRLSPTAISPDLHAGAAIAAALDTTRQSYFRVGNPLSEAIRQGFRALCTEWGDYEAPEHHVKSFENTAAAFLAYWQDPPEGKNDPGFNPETNDQFRPMRRPDGSIATEYSFAIPLPILHPDSGEPFIYCGRTDMIGSFQHTPKLLWIEDDKTTKSIGSSWAAKWKLRGQFIGYTWAARQELKLPVEGVLVRGIGIQKTQFKFAEATIPISNMMIQRWYNQMLEDINRFCWVWDDYKSRKALNEPEPWRAFNMSLAEACESYNGCQYMDLCGSACPENWYDSFSERLWNPLLRDPSWETRKLGEQSIEGLMRAKEPEDARPVYRS